MGTLTITKNYADTTLLEETDLDSFINNTETFFNTTKINDDNIQNAGITASEKLQDGTLSTAKFQSDSIVEAGIAANAVTTAKITDSNVTTAKIADSNVTTAKIADGAVTTAKTNSSYSITNINSYNTITSNTYTLATSSTLQLNSRPVLIEAIFSLFFPAFYLASSSANLNIKKNSTTIATYGIVAGNNYFCTSGGDSHTVCFLDEVGASGATTYSLELVLVHNDPYQSTIWGETPSGNVTYPNPFIVQEL